MQDTSDQTDKLMRNERRGVWLGLAVVLVLATTLVLGSDTRNALLLALAISLVFGVIWLGQQRTRGAKETLQIKREIVIQDELRQGAIAQAYKWAFLVVLAALASFCVASTIVIIALPGQMVAALTVALGATTFLATFLLRDRG